MTEDELKKLVKESAPLIDRLKDCKRRIGKMCSEGRPPKMTVPVYWNDDDWFINRTIDEAIEEINGLIAFKRSVDEALNMGDGSYRP